MADARGVRREARWDKGGLPRKPMEAFMADDTSKRGPADRSRINLSEVHEVRYWSDALGLSEDELRQAVEAAGPMVSNVRAHLRSGGVGASR